MKSSIYDWTGMDMQQKQIQTIFRDLYDVPIMKGELMDLKFPSAAFADHKFEHTLGRVPKGFIPVMIFGQPATIYVSPTQVNSPEKEIILRSNIADLKARIWIF
jgi:hypothetical protein